MATSPIIKRARIIRGNKLILRDVGVGDAEFILSLRLDPKKNAYISAVDPRLQKQIDWINTYLNGGGQAYFIICDRELNRLGTVRLYDAVGGSFSWGSWIVQDEAPAYVAIESALLVYRYALDYLHFTSAHFEVSRDNKSVWIFHERFGAHRVRETKGQYFYKIASGEIDLSFSRYRKFLPNSIEVLQPQI
jgi:RimJ/RimL family protein N-acetyltransferase